MRWGCCSPGPQRERHWERCSSSSAARSSCRNSSSCPSRTWSASADCTRSRRRSRRDRQGRPAAIPHQSRQSKSALPGPHICRCRLPDRTKSRPPKRRRRGRHLGVRISRPRGTLPARENRPDRVHTPVRPGLRTCTRHPLDRRSCRRCIQDTRVLRRTFSPSRSNPGHLGKRRHYRPGRGGHCTCSVRRWDRSFGGLDTSRRNTRWHRHCSPPPDCRLQYWPGSQREPPPQVHRPVTSQVSFPAQGVSGQGCSTTQTLVAGLQISSEAQMVPPEPPHLH
jgi:hypothetical protein